MEKTSTLEVALCPREKPEPGEDGSEASSSAPIAWPLFFDAVPQELLDNVLRFLSLLPHGENWDRRVRLIDVMELYRVDGGLGTFLSTRFRALSVSKSTDGYYERQSNKFDDICQRMLWTDNIDVAHDFIKKAGGNFLRTIVIGEGMYDDDRNGRDIVDDFRAACPNVRSLSVVEQFGRWSSAFGTQLERLDVTSKIPTVAIPNSCPALRKLSFLGNPSHDHGSLLNGIDWEFIGSKLESLSISLVSITDGDLERMRKHCGNLNHIEIQSQYEGSKAIADFIVSYGDQLELVYVESMEEDELNLIVEECKNAHFDAAIFENRFLLPTLRILGHRLEKIYFSLVEDDIATREWTAAWNLCPDLENISISSFTFEKASAIMDTPKHSLKRLQISVLPSMEEENSESKMKEMMDRFAEGTKHVEIADIEWDFDGGSSHPFEKFIHKNISCLRKFSLCVYGCHLTKPCADELVEQLLQCPLLQEITFRGVFKPAESILSTLQKRGIYFVDRDAGGTEEEALVYEL